MSEENNAAITVAPTTQVAVSSVSGFGGSRLFRPKPGNINLVQNMTQQEGAIPGKLRISETGQHFEEIQAVMLAIPPDKKPREFRIKGVFKKEGLHCFSYDGIKPSEHAPYPKAEKCDGCPQADWSKWRANKIQDNLPPCKDYYRALIAERSTKLPYWAKFKGKSISAFEGACQNIARQFAIMQANGLNPQIYDVSFTIYVTKVGALYVHGFKDFAPVTDPAARAEFGAIFEDFARRRAEYEQSAASEDGNATVDAAVSGAPATQQTAQNTPQPVRVAPRTPRPAVVIPKGPTITIPPVEAADNEVITI
jgi:hypothetical protein